MADKASEDADAIIRHIAVNAVAEGQLDCFRIKTGFCEFSGATLEVVAERWFGGVGAEKRTELPAEDVGLVACDCCEARIGSSEVG
jgi:hypothetical protein